MQRVRIGLTGLACVFLLVLLAAAFFGLTNNEQSTGQLVVSNIADPASNGVTPAILPREPLAELGVAPGYAGDGGNAVVVAAPAAVPVLDPAPAAPILPGSRN